MTPAQRMTYNLSQRGIIAQRNGKKWNLLQTDTATATRALFNPAVIDTATWRKIADGITAKQAMEYLK